MLRGILTNRRLHARAFRAARRGGSARDRTVEFGLVRAHVRLNARAPLELARAAGHRAHELVLVRVHALMFAVVAHAPEQLAAVLALELLIERWQWSLSRCARFPIVGGIERGGGLHVRFVNELLQPCRVLSAWTHGALMSLARMMMR